jgi:hypothetical protein
VRGAPGRVASDDRRQEDGVLRLVLIGGPCWDGLPALFNTFCRFSTGGSVCVAAPVGIVSVLSLLKFAAAQECAGCKFVRTLLLLESCNREVAGVVRSHNDSHSIAGGGELDQMFAGLRARKPNKPL